MVKHAGEASIHGVTKTDHKPTGEDTSCESTLSITDQARQGNITDISKKHALPIKIHEHSGSTSPMVQV